MRCLLLLLALLLAPTAAWAQTHDQVSTSIDTLLASGKTPPISATDLRTVLHQMNDGMFGNMPFIATGGTAARAPDDRAADVINVMDYGAVCDDVVDDAAAINSAINAARNSVHASFTVTIQFPKNRKCLINSPINMTGLHSGSPVQFGNTNRVYFKDAFIDCHVTADVCIDALGSLRLVFEEVMIVAPGAFTPTIGIQIGVNVVGTTAGNNTFEHVTMFGSFSLAGIYNFGSEVILYNDVYITNNADGYAAILDGFNHFGVTSAFQPQQSPANTAVSFNDQIFMAGRLQTLSTTKPALWVGGTGHSQFYNTFMATGSTSCHLVMYFIANDYFDNMQETTFDVHFETTTATDTICLDGTTNAPIIRGFVYKDHAVQASNSIFKILGTSSITSVRVDDLQVSAVTAPQTAGAPQKLFDDATKWSVSGSIYVSHSAMWTPPQFFAGRACVGNANYKCFTKTIPILVSALPTCNNGNEGAQMAVSDATSTTFNATAVGGGANHMQVQCNSVNWVLH